MFPCFAAQKFLVSIQPRIGVSPDWVTTEIETVDIAWRSDDYIRVCGANVDISNITGFTSPKFDEIPDIAGTFYVIGNWDNISDNSGGTESDNIARWVPNNEDNDSSKVQGNWLPFSDSDTDDFGMAVQSGVYYGADTIEAYTVTANGTVDANVTITGAMLFMIYDKGRFIDVIYGTATWHQNYEWPGYDWWE
ncbi:MAG: hypothetical protein H8E20_13635 [Verrucomicrobia bacterium]|nr:hypothetical protein [Verrucomicrobiota bacterium]